MPDYDDTRFHPAAPVASITLRNPETSQTLPDVQMLIDSGADVTLLPSAAVELLGIIADPTEKYELVAFNGQTSSAQAARLHLILLGKTFNGRFLLIRQDWAILGRDVLNHLALILDGPRRAWDERPD